jgi:hypothetical protein
MMSWIIHRVGILMLQGRDDLTTLRIGIWDPDALKEDFSSGNILLQTYLV